MVTSPATSTAARAAARPLGTLRDLVALGKPRLSFLVIFTTAAGMWLAPGAISGARAVLAVLATSAVVGAANALNCWLERETDGLMRRTRDRPLPAGRLDPVVALGLGLLVPAFALPVLALTAGPLTALLSLVALVSYVAVYTPLKQRSPAALFVGAVPGAIPPLMGWVAVTGRIDWGGLALFALLFTWQLPHFLAISLYLEEDYARGGHKVFPLVYGRTATRRAIALTSALLVPVAAWPAVLGLVTPLAGGLAALASLLLLGLALAGQGARGEGTRWARRFFLATLVHLTVTFVALFSGAQP